MYNKYITWLSLFQASLKTNIERKIRSVNLHLYYKSSPWNVVYN